MGVDPIASKFVENFSDESVLISDFFTKENYFNKISDKAKIITSVAMFYDLEDPNKFIEDVTHELHPDGIWHLEQNYSTWMMKTSAFDTICHEHLEYYSYSVLENMLQNHNLKIIDVELNQANGGSIAITAGNAKLNLWKDLKPLYADVLREAEEKLRVKSIKSWQGFKSRSLENIEFNKRLIMNIDKRNETLAGLGASTKGNILLHTLGEYSKKIEVIGEVNKEKYGSFTSSGNIPIKPEAEVLSSNFDYLIVLPWHFRGTFEKLRKQINFKSRLIFPLPDIEII